MKPSDFFNNYLMLLANLSQNVKQIYGYLLMYVLSYFLQQAKAVTFIRKNLCDRAFVSFITVQQVTENLITELMSFSVFSCCLLMTI